MSFKKSARDYQGAGVGKEDDGDKHERTESKDDKHVDASGKPLVCTMNMC